MKNNLKLVCTALILSLTAGLITACPNDAKTGQTDNGSKSVIDEVDVTTRQTETGLMPDISEPNQTIETMNPSDPSESSSETSSGESTSGTTAKPTAKPLGKVKITDAYKSTYKSKYEGKVTSRIPKISIEGVSTKAINKEIGKLISKAKAEAKSKEWYYSYSYYIGKTYVSIIISRPEWNDTGDNYVYNISRKTGKKLSKKQMLKAVGVSSKKFNSRVKKAIVKYWKPYKKYLTNKVLKAEYKKAISSKMVKKAVPYVNSKGKLSFKLNDLPCYGGAGWVSYTGTC